MKMLKSQDIQKTGWSLSENEKPIETFEQYICLTLFPNEIKLGELK